MSCEPAIRVDYDLAACEASVRNRPASVKCTGRIDVNFDLIGQLITKYWSKNFLPYQLTQVMQYDVR